MVIQNNNATSRQIGIDLLRIFAIVCITNIHYLGYDPIAHYGKLMKTVLNYMMNNWLQLIKYTGEAQYTIDNSVAERSIRPFTIGRKNSISFGSEDGAQVASVYYTFVEICRLRGISPKDYFVQFFRWIVFRRTDYEAMMPALFIE